MRGLDQENGKISMTPKPKSDRGDQSSERRNELLLIAAREFATHGYAATTVRDIADAAGILSGSLYHHFASKEAMLQEILRGFLDGLLGRFEEIRDADRGVLESLELLVETSFAVIEAQPEAVTLYQNEFPYMQGEPGFEFLLEKSKQIEAIWRGQLEAGQRSGVFRDSFDTGLVYRFIRDGIWSSVRWYRPSGTHTAGALAQTYIDLLRQGLRAE